MVCIIVNLKYSLYKHFFFSQTRLIMNATNRLQLLSLIHLSHSKDRIELQCHFSLILPMVCIVFICEWILKTALVLLRWGWLWALPTGTDPWVWFLSLAQTTKCHCSLTSLWFFSWFAYQLYENILIKDPLFPLRWSWSWTWSTDYPQVSFKFSQPEFISWR